MSNVKWTKSVLSNLLPGPLNADEEKLICSLFEHLLGSGGERKMTIIQTVTLVHSMYQAGQRPPVCKTSTEQNGEVGTREIAECIPDKLPDLEPAENSEEENPDAGITLVIDERGKIRNEEFENENKGDSAKETTFVKSNAKRRKTKRVSIPYPVPVLPVRKSKRTKSEEQPEEFFAEKIIQTKVEQPIRLQGLRHIGNCGCTFAISTPSNFKDGQT